LFYNIANDTSPFWKKFDPSLAINSNGKVAFLYQLAQGKNFYGVFSASNLLQNNRVDEFNSWECVQDASVRLLICHPNFEAAQR
jgi:hypothetical protein